MQNAKAGSDRLLDEAALMLYPVRSLNHTPVRYIIQRLAEGYRIVENAAYG